MKKIALFGSTGSIGTQTLEVVRSQTENFSVEILTAHNNAPLLIKQAREFQPNMVIIGNESLYEVIFDALEDLPIKVYAGNDALEQIASSDSYDMMMMAISGIQALKPLIQAIQSNKEIALANKEALVMAGPLIMKEFRKSRSRMVPVDSELSAIFQCLQGETGPIDKIFLTASGGPFLNHSKISLKNVNVEEALNHPVWEMGDKVSIDSATLMNKGMELICASYLFEIESSNIEVVIHPQGFIHSMVQFPDGSIKSQMAFPDMKMPIQYALNFPTRLDSNEAKRNPLDFPPLTFEAPDFEKFRNLALAYKALKKGGNSPCILNAANEIAIKAFLNHQIGFVQIPDVVEKCLKEIQWIESPALKEYFECDSQTRLLANEIVLKLRS